MAQFPNAQDFVSQVLPELQNSRPQPLGAGGKASWISRGRWDTACIKLRGSIREAPHYLRIENADKTIAEDRTKIIVEVFISEPEDVEALERLTERNVNELVSNCGTYYPDMDPATAGTLIKSTHKKVLFQKDGHKLQTKMTLEGKHAGVVLKKLPVPKTEANPTGSVSVRSRWEDIVAPCEVEIVLTILGIHFGAPPTSSMMHRIKFLKFSESCELDPFTGLPVASGAEPMVEDALPPPVSRTQSAFFPEEGVQSM